MTKYERAFLCLSAVLLLIIIFVSGGDIYTERQAESLQGQIKELQAQVETLEAGQEDINVVQAWQALRLEDVSRGRAR
ncbi:MAG: hypothetical protein NC238_08980 [Dehalobacter sp.]|nr:hypothetical protein [Dehalobacter sp.]